MIMALIDSAVARAVVSADTVPNPFDQTSPDISVFGIDFGNKLYAILGGVWGIAFVYAAVRLVIAFVKFMGAKKVQHNPDALEDATGHLKIVSLGIVGLAGAAAVFTALVNLFG